MRSGTTTPPITTRDPAPSHTGRVMYALATGPRTAARVKQAMPRVVQLRGPCEARSGTWSAWRRLDGASQGRTKRATADGPRSDA